MIEKIEVDFSHYREDENIYLFHYRIEFSNDFFDKVIITDKIEVNDNNDLIEIFDKIEKKMEEFYPRKGGLNG